MSTAVTISPLICKRTPMPHACDAIFAALHRAAVALVDDKVRYIPAENVFSVFDTESLTYVYAMLFVGFAEHASDIVMSAEEQEIQILLCAEGKLRDPRANLSPLDILPDGEDVRDFIDRLMREGGMAFSLDVKEDTLRFVLALPRFLVGRYDVAAFERHDVCEDFYLAMLLRAGLPIPSKHHRANANS